MHSAFFHELLTKMSQNDSGIYPEVISHYLLDNELFSAYMKELLILNIIIIFFDQFF